jgi:predicted nucleic acid-binding protein
MKQRIYIDTSLVGGYFDEEFEEATIKLFERLNNNEVVFVVSDLLDLELINAPQQVREHLLKFSADKFERVELTEEAVILADSYINEKVVGKTSLEDCRHIALATIHKVDVLASWNFKHIVNLDRIKGYNSVNLRLGYSMIEIRSPKDLVNYGND